MSVTSLSFTFVNMYAPQSAKPAAASERPSHCAHSDAAPSESQRPGGRQNRLVDAMMSALRELGVGSQPAASTSPTQTPAPAAAVASNVQAQPAESVTTNDAATAAAAVAATAETDTAAAATTAPASAEPAATLESAVAQFASELFRALRQVGRGESSDEGSSRVDGEGGRMRHHGHHHGHHGWRNHGYGDMSQRLDALSQTFAAQTPAAAATEAAGNPVVSSSISITLTVQDGPAEAPVQALTTASAQPAVSSGNTEQAATPAAATAATPVATAASPAKNPLLEAFSNLFNAIKPQGAGAADTDMSSKLRTFLQTLAQAMRPETMATIQTPQIGGLMNVTA